MKRVHMTVAAAEARPRDLPPQPHARQHLLQRRSLYHLGIGLDRLIVHPLEQSPASVELLFAEAEDEAAGTAVVHWSSSRLRQIIAEGRPEVRAGAREGSVFRLRGALSLHPDQAKIGP